jgi:uncharacterized protein YecE (DUF72 family)
MAAIRIGISGWRYEPWRGLFYPADLPQRSELAYASRVLPIIEINGSFYSLQRPESYARWYEETPPGFVFSVKAPRYITHMRRLREVEEPVANFLASGLFNLKEKLGPILWQFPPNFKYDRERMEPFLDLLPHDTQAASALARKRSAWMKGRSRLVSDEQRQLRHAIEIRHDSFLDPTFIELLRERNVALVVAETARRWPMTHDITADFVYMRLHGDRELYRSGYGDKALERWARRIRAWSSGMEPQDAQKVLNEKPPSAKERDVYCFFDNTDVKLRAPFDAQTLMRKLGLSPGSPPLPAGRRRAPADTVVRAATKRVGAEAAAGGTAGIEAKRGASGVKAAVRVKPAAKAGVAVRAAAAARAKAAGGPRSVVGSKTTAGARIRSQARPRA